VVLNLGLVNEEEVEDGENEVNEVEAEVVVVEVEEEAEVGMTRRNGFQSPSLVV
jgi:hypothetical protein